MKKVALQAAPQHRLSALQRVAREAAAAQALSGLQPPPTGVVRYFACVYDAKEDAVVFVMQLCRGPCLADLIRREPAGRLPEGRVRPMLVSVAQALGHLHSAGLLCVDLKAENVVLDATSEDPDRVLLVDFDLCRDLPGSSRCRAVVAAATAAAGGVLGADEEPSDMIWGTAEYLSYELLKDGAAAYSPASDWWALGVLSYELLYGRPPWSGPSLEALLQRISNHSPAFQTHAEGGPRVSQRMQHFIRELLRHRPDVRLGSQGGVQEVLAHAALTADK